MTNRKGDQINLKNEIVFDQNETWRFQVTAVNWLRVPTTCLLLNLQNINLPYFSNLNINMRTIDSTSLGYLVHATDQYEAKYETTPNEHEYEHDHVMVSCTFVPFNLLFQFIIIDTNT